MRLREFKATQARKIQGKQAARLDPRCMALSPRADSNSSITLSSYKQGAKRRGLEFTIGYYEAKDLLASPCHYCNWPAPNGIDRVDNAVGYTTENCVSCCVFCNMAKGSKHVDEFRKWITHIKGQLPVSVIM